MAVTLTEADYQDLWEQNIPAAEEIATSASTEVIEQCPQHLGTGYRRWFNLRGLALLIHDYEFHNSLKLKLEPWLSEPEFGFQLSGKRCTRTAGQNFLQAGLLLNTQEEFAGGERILQVDIHLESLSLLNEFLASDHEQLPEALRQLLESKTEQAFDQVGTITPAMQLALEQILHCPYHGPTQQLYLESKCLELMALRIDQLISSSENQPRPSGLQADDLNRIHAARDILVRRLNNPPSLLSLARQVGLNDYKLKLGFRHVFGTTVFGYLHAYRMEQARRLLVERQMKVQEAAQAVGYASASRFTAAFKRKFGVNPSRYLNE